MAEIVCGECGYRVTIVRTGQHSAKPEHDLGFPSLFGIENYPLKSIGALYELLTGYVVCGGVSFAPELGSPRL
jgi:hypothetical protein